MSNLSNSGASAALAPLWETIPQVAYGMARGKDGMADSARDMFYIVDADETIIVDNLAADFYREVRTQAVAIGIAKGKPLNDQTSKSEASQISKLENFPLLGECSRVNLHVMPAFEYARDLTGSGYTKLVKAAVALKKVLAKDIDADYETMRVAIFASQAAKPEVASEVVAGVKDTLHALVFGTDKAEPKHEPLFAQLLATHPADYVQRTLQALDVLAACVKQIEAARDAKIATSK